MSLSKVIIVGGHGKVALRLAGLLAKTGKHAVTSIIRTESQVPDLKAVSDKIEPLILSIEDASVADFTKVFEGQEVIVWSAGAGGAGGPERTRKVDYEGAVKVYDAIETVQGAKPRLVLVSAIDVGNPDVIPPHYNDADIAMRKRVRTVIAHYMEMKYLADKDLVKRTAFKWTILRPGGLTLEPGTGKADIGRTHITTQVSRDDVALALSLLVDRPDAAGLAIDMVGGDKSVPDQVEDFIKKGETDWLG
ncbi:NAD(P)-binding protein [Vararia minispora EC-137]|uniref:NAD(P)-binding protein n=1 Tax=Vararia minispora EC-137 TaxID=1314806 RepID=A0ACB8QFS7_9AGAM|nr:NAD(P)-binding protein [Vararia minispora EC-137]